MKKSNRIDVAYKCEQIDNIQHMPRLQNIIMLIEVLTLIMRCLMRSIHFDIQYVGHVYTESSASKKFFNVHDKFEFHDACHGQEKKN
jgi:hypothetical protein